MLILMAISQYVAGLISISLSGSTISFLQPRSVAHHRAETRGKYEYQEAASWHVFLEVVEMFVIFSENDELALCASRLARAAGLLALGDQLGYRLLVACDYYFLAGSQLLDQLSKVRLRFFY
jgi:hypothetical protein